MGAPTKAPLVTAGASRFRRKPREYELSVVVVTEASVLPMSLRVFSPSVTRVATSVLSTDDVVVLYGSGLAPVCASLAGAMGPSLPPVMVLAPALDREDVLAAFRYGATSYLLDRDDEGDSDEAPCMPCVVRGTARRESHLDPAVARVLIENVRRAPADPAAAPEAEHIVGNGSGLSGREREVMEALVKGHSPGEIAVRLSLTEKTVRNYLSKIYQKLEVHSQSQAILRWLGRSPEANS